jgi:UDP-N-acetylmuramoylalanine--D-glutamate ligase
MNVTAETLSSISVAALVTAMITNDKQKSAYTLVVGLGITGLSVARYLISRGETVVVTDSRENPPGLDALRTSYPQTEIVLGEFDEALFMGADRIIVSPGVSTHEGVLQHVIQQGVEVIGDIELFAQHVNAPLLAITGSNGKSTVTTLLGEMAKASAIDVRVGGNLGTPALDLLDEKAELYVLELSSFQLENLYSLKPLAAVVLNVSPDHLDRYDSFESYVKAKQNIYHNCQRVVVNRDDPYVDAMQAGHRQVAGFTLHEPAGSDYGLRCVDDEIWLCKGNEKVVRQSDVKLQGQHNIANVLAALAVADAAGFSRAAVLQTIRTFSGLAHRTQFVAEKNHVSWVNDSKGTNVGATMAAISGIEVKNRLILIAGGLAKDADFSSLRSVVEDKVRSVVLIGKDAPKIEQALQDVVPVWYAKDMFEAVGVAAELAHPGDTVLLSPACASFDMFNGYQQRGDVFIQAVEALA